ncbi:MAG: reverse transcriptase, partial [Pseudomonadota bacterium]|nr:reverse transcriptase [Pseudomonadota bacterium]
KALTEQSMPLIAIVVDIAYRNPRTYAICAAILSKLMSFLESADEKIAVAEKVKARFAKIPNTGHMQIWIQRVILPISAQLAYEEPICKLVAGEPVALWNIEWISAKALKDAIDTAKIIDRDAIEGLEPVIPVDEVELFLSKTIECYYE